MGQICDQANKWAEEAENTVFEVNKLGVSSINEFQILKANLNQIQSQISSMEVGAHTAISKVHYSVQDLITINIEESDLYSFGK